MKKFAVVIVLGLGLSVHIPCQAGDTTGSTATKVTAPAPSAPASTKSNSSSAGSTAASATTVPTTNTEANKTVPVENTTGKSKHHKKVAHKHKNNPDNPDNFVGDGVPLSKLGAHKDVDGGYDFDNSKKFH